MDKFHRHIRPEVVNNRNKNKSVTGVYEGNVLKIGVSICSNNDNFNRKLGRKISEGRAVKTPEITIEAEDFPTALKHFHTYCNTLGGKPVTLKEEENVSN